MGIAGRTRSRHRSARNADRAGNLLFKEESVPFVLVRPRGHREKLTVSEGMGWSSALIQEEPAPRAHRGKVRTQPLGPGCSSKSGRGTRDW